MHQYLKLQASELAAYGLRKPPGMEADQEVVLRGGSTLILDEFGTVKYEIHNKLPARTDEAGLARAQQRLEYLWREGSSTRGTPSRHVCPPSTACGERGLRPAPGGLVMAVRPNQVRIRSYNVGFGDCYLITFRYPSERCEMC